MSNYKIETKCIQSGYEPGNGEPRILPIYQSTTFRYTSSEQMGRLFDLEESGYFYTRLQNPTNDAVAAKEIIANYKPQYPSIKAYLDAIDALTLDKDAVKYDEKGNAIVDFQN